MLYCQPESFYNEMKYLSENNSNFLKKICLTQYQIDSTISIIEPISFIIKMVLNETDDFYGMQQILALRTFGYNDCIEPESNHRIMNIYYAAIVEGSLLITKPLPTWIYIKDGVVYYKSTDEYGDEYHYTLDDIAKAEDDPYAINSYITYHENVFKHDMLLAKIPTIILKNLA